MPKLLFLLLSIIPFLTFSKNSSRLHHIREERLAKMNLKQIQCAWENGQPFIYSPEHGYLPYNWVSQITGQDLAKHFMNKNYHNKVVKIGVIDSYFYEEPLHYNTPTDLPSHGLKPLTLAAQAKPGDRHAYSVVERIVSPQFGATTNGSIQFLKELNDIEDPEQIPLVWDSLAKNDIRIVNMSYISFYGPSSLIRNKAINERNDNLILVMSSGNNADDGQLKVYPSTEKTKGIIVGSSSAIGGVTRYSQESSNVDILAPVDYLLPINFPYSPKDHDIVAGTSFASPQVTGAIANALAILPELHLANIKLLLKKTATPLIYQKTREFLDLNKSTFENGAGNLNAYKLVRVVDRIKKTYQNYIDENNKRGFLLDENDEYVIASKRAYLKKLIMNPKFYDFKEEAKNLYYRAIKLLGFLSCKSQESAIDILRESVFLDLNSPAAKMLMFYYDTNELDPLALYLDSITTNTAHAFVKKLSSEERKHYFSRFLYKY